MPYSKVFSHLSRQCMLFRNHAMWNILPWCPFSIKIRLSLKILLNSITFKCNTLEGYRWTGTTNCKGSFRPLENIFCRLFLQLYFTLESFCSVICFCCLCGLIWISNTVCSPLLVPWERFLPPVTSFLTLYEKGTDVNSSDSAHCSSFL